MFTGFPRDYKPVPLKWLPTKGKNYPENTEIYVTPMSIRERRLLEGVSSAEYYRRLLDGVQIRGGQLERKNLAFADAQFIDLARRIYTYEADRKLWVNNYPCYHCGKTNVKASFKFDELELEDLPEDVFGFTKTLIDPETEKEQEVFYPGKEYTFADGLKVYVSPLTVGEYIDLATRYIANKDDEEDSEAYIAQFAYLIKQVDGKEFKDIEAQREWLFNYISNLYKPADEETLDSIEKDTTSILKPLKAKCPDCGKEVEVYVSPWMRFQQ